ncbi:hypothetical protein SAMN05660420_02555 [Desulfuromusa kysingii]|uniref:Uncharacterized protein n=1 Tax=Desulfuromusa kysingii TaxID=37625 RepID=A0A1H4CHV1_9BACT|nr:hypothetical protein [Desulfuromusa kysingii]SEA59937.1 hypothetical protein SAMN05660420_02555 [Desulfuromusa kysingii]
MKLQEKVLLYGFALFSVITSFLFVFYAVNVNFSRDASQWLRLFSYVAGGYGLFNIYILSWAWRIQSAWAPKADMVIAACFFGVVIMDTVREGFSTSMTTIGSILGLALILLANWYAVNKVCHRHHQ